MRYFNCGLLTRDAPSQSRARRGQGDARATSDARIDGFIWYTSGHTMTAPNRSGEEPPETPSVVEGDDGTDPTLMRWLVRGGERVLMLRGTPPGAPERPQTSRPKPPSGAHPVRTDSGLSSLADAEVVEILDGEIVVGPRPGPAETRAAMELLVELRMPLGMTDGAASPWIFLKEPELRLGAHPDQLVPDLAGWRREQLPQRPSTTAIEVAPEWVCEVVSNHTRAHDRALKMPCYLKHGVRYLWLLDPSCETLEVFLQRDGQWTLLSARSGRAVVREEPFAFADVSLARLWAW